MYVFLEMYVSWRSKKQTSVALSTAEAKYVALASTAQEALWLKHLRILMRLTTCTEPLGANEIYLIYI